MLAAELRLMLKGYHWSWYVLAAGLVAVQLAVPYEYTLKYALPAAWVWPLALWSGMGAREARFNTQQLVFSSAYPVSRQFPAVWMAGLLVALLAGGGMLLRAVLSGDVAFARALLIGMLFVPTFALALGTISGSKKLFEVIYLLMWYVGPVNGLVPLDFLGATEAAATSSIPMVYLAVTVGLGITSILWRRKQASDGRG
jgi:hypothetical protein